MGFSIGNLIGSVAPALGGFLGGLPGLILGRGIQAGLESPVGRQTAVSAPPARTVAATSVVPTTQRVSLQSLPTAVRSGFLGPLGRAVGSAAVGALTFEAGQSFFGNGNGQTELSQILAQARANSPGATKKKIIAAARTCGIDLAADLFGLDAREICLVVVAGVGRRRRGVSAADIRRTKRTIRFAAGITRDLKQLSGPARARRK